MFQDAELRRLRLQKDLLIVQCDTQRLQLAMDWRQLRSPGFWMNEAGKAAQRHPARAVALGVGLGAIAVKALRRPRAIIGLLGSLGGAASTAVSLWKLFDGRGARK